MYWMEYLRQLTMEALYQDANFIDRMNESSIFKKKKKKGWQGKNSSVIDVSFKHGFFMRSWWQQKKETI